MMDVLAVITFGMLCCTAQGVLGKDDGVDGPMKVTVFYESYCPDCIVDFQENIMDAWRLFKKEFQLDLVPFGNAQQSYVHGHFKFQCQHGPKECVANKLHACAIWQSCGEGGSVGCDVAKLDQALHYIYCVIQEPDQLEASEKCAQEQGLDPEGVEKCAQNDKGDFLESGYGNRTKSFRPHIQYVPTIAIDGKHDKAAEKNLVKEICALRPKMCENIVFDSNRV